MTVNTNQKKDNELIKMSFKGNEHLLKLMRALFFGFDLSKAEKNQIKTSFANPELRKAVQKKLFPVLDMDVPVGEESDFWGGIETQIFNHHQDAIYQAVSSKAKAQEMFNQAIVLLEDPFGTPIDFTYSPTSLALDPLQVKLLARSLYYKAVTIMLATLKVIAEQIETETPQEAARRLSSNSMK